MATVNGAPPPQPPPSNVAAQRPSQTLYCSNLPDRLRKDDLKRCLYMLFSTYGTILDIVALKTVKMRGQAHVLFRDTQASIQAMRALQGFEFFGKHMKIQYAKTKSDTLAKLDGTYRQPVVGEGTKPIPAGDAQTQVQRSIFAGPPGTAGVPPAAPHGVPGGGAVDVQTTSKQTAGVKRTREESEAVEDDAPMDMDDDSDAAMDESD